MRAACVCAGWLALLFTLTFIGLNPRPFPLNQLLSSLDWDTTDPLSVLHRLLLAPSSSSYLQAGLRAFHQYTTHVLLYTLSITDLSPNLGLYWYFFAEMFDTFRAFFVAVVQLFTVALAVPVCIRFRYVDIYVLFFVCLFK